MQIIKEIISNLTQKTIDFAPNILSAIIFLILAFIVLKIINKFLNSYLSKKIQENALIQITKLIIKLVAYYTIILTLLAILGLNDLAASLGTALGFLALGVSFALKNVITDIVSGFYLIKDPDIQKGDKIESDKGSGIVKKIGIKKTRLKTPENNVLVLANSDVEKKWTKIKEKKETI